MKKLNKIIIAMAVVAALFCSGCSFAPGTYTNSQPYDVQSQDENDWSVCACGAFSMAYYLAEQGIISSKNVSSKAKSLYRKVIFDKSSELWPYSEPIKIQKEMSKYVSKAELRMHKVDEATRKMARDPENLIPIDIELKAEILLHELSIYLKYNDSDIIDITDFASALGKNEYVIEIVDTDRNVTLAYDDFYVRNSLHYVLTYWKGDVLYTLDPFRGKEAPRSDFMDGTLEEWNFCNGGIFLTPKAK